MKGILRSMTGFARVRRPFEDGEVVVSVKSVNHRGLDIQIYAPPAADPMESAMRSAVKNKVARGHVEARLSLPKQGTAGAVTVNREMLDAYLSAFRTVSVELGLKTDPDLNSALRLPGMFEDAPAGELPVGLETAVLETLDEALDALNEFRAREGSEIGAELLSHNEAIRAAAAEMERIRGGALEAFQSRLLERLSNLLAGAQIDPQRLAQEVAILVDKSDIGEEIARLKIHAGQLDAIVKGGGEVGKKLDFLLQEMNRETNTILSKTGGAGESGLKITELALAAKSAIEKIREQSLNLE